jgi:hypothetical protein
VQYSDKIYCIVLIDRFRHYGTKLRMTYFLTFPAIDIDLFKAFWNTEIGQLLRPVRTYILKSFLVLHASMFFPFCIKI